MWPERLQDCRTLEAGLLMRQICCVAAIFCTEYVYFQTRCVNPSAGTQSANT